MPIITATRHTTSGRDSRPVTEPIRAAGRAPLLRPRWLASRRFTGLALAATGLAATFAAAIAGHGHLGRGAAAQIGFAASVTIFAVGEALRSPALTVIVGDRAPSGTARRRQRLGTLALVTGALLTPPAGGAALGAGWGTSLLTALAAGCAVASVTATRPGRQTGARHQPHPGRRPVNGKETP